MVLPLLGFVLLDGMMLYGALIIAFLFILFCLENDKPGWCTIDIIVVLVALQFLTNIHPLQFVLQNPVYIVFYVLGYLAIGTGWLFVKWPVHVYKIKNKFDAIKDDMMKRFKRDYGNLSGYFNADNTLTDIGTQKFLSLCAYDIGERSLPINVKVYKSRLYMWWICWPASVFWTIFADFVKSIWNFVYNTIAGWLQKISDASIKMP